MMKKYTLKENQDGSQYIEMIDENGVMSFVPMADDNSDYQAYLEHLTEIPTPSEA